ncbi:cytochrome P450 [Phanerochaete sordida]|uniref:Cytochrome P450 n=1 Tax=Phanerochaete sordida TaxID=48140 RepID=A0A9P3G497_9APHY|nr:cytochrome P450 [Phanerochaete sordida]
MYALLGGILCLVVFHQAYTGYQRRRLHAHIPAVGSDNVLSSYFTAMKYWMRANDIIHEGYRKHKGSIFKIPQFTGWLFIASGDELVEELRNADENVLSSAAALVDLLQTDYTIGRSVRENLYHIHVLRTTLNKNLASILPDAIDEIAAAFKDELDAKLGDGEWTPLAVTDLFTRIICRVSNRSFVGLPLCRIPDYCTTVESFAQNVVLGGTFLNCFPDFLRPAVASVVNTTGGNLRKMMHYTGPVVDERKRLIEEHGEDYPGKPVDMLSWIIDNAPHNEHYSTENLVRRVLTVNFVALHSTSLSFVHALYSLAARQQYIMPLREELEQHLGKEPATWTKDSFNPCWKLDSFLKESQRLNGLGAFSLLRKTMRPYTFRDGTWLPEGVIVTASQTASHTDSEHFTNADTFDGFRFFRARERAAQTEAVEYTQEHLEDQGSEDWQYRLTSTSPHYLAFGGGRHVCPGRFYAALELKCMLSFLLLNYDVRMKDAGVRPPDVWIGPTSLPSSSAKVEFRRRT